MGKNKYLRKIIFVINGVILFYLIIYVDVVLRARSAYIEGEKYLDFYYNPQKKEEFFNKKFEKEKDTLEKMLKKNKIAKEEYQTKLELLKFKIEFQKKESSVKYAYIWYKTVLDLFSKPTSKWSELAKQKVEVAKQLWMKELTSKGYKVEDYMIE